MQFSCPRLLLRGWINCQFAEPTGPCLVRDKNIWAGMRDKCLRAGCALPIFRAPGEGSVACNNQ